MLGSAAQWDRTLTFRHERQQGHDGGYRLVSWDDSVGHSVIWEYDAQDQFQRRGVITHWPSEISEGGVTGEVVWQDANGHEVERLPLRAGQPDAR
jgi:hypothetical protein